MVENQSVYKVIRKRIVLLEYQPGQVLREKELAKEFKISRTPVREAFIRLEMDGLVKVFPNLGTIVSEVSFKQLKDVFEVRSYLVRFSGKLAAARITTEELTRARELVEQMEGVEDHRELMRLDMEMHDLINKAAKNEEIARILSGLRDQAVRIWAFDRSEVPFLENLAEEFTEILNAMERRDEEESGRLLERHTGRFIEHIRNQISP